MVDSGKPLIPGPYRVLKEIKSYRNRVFLCEDEQSWKKLAIKEQKGVFTSANELVSCCLFTRLCHLIHPNVMRMYRVECDAEDNAFLVAEFVKGKRADLLIHGTGFPAVIPEDFAFTPGLDLKKLTILRDVAAALDYIHRCGVLHLDVKPSNVIVADDGHAKLIDFDLAACINGGQVDRHGRKCGTPPYMAPEIWRCKPLTPATDQWALAVFAYELISGQWPYWVENSMNRYWSEDFPLYRSWNSYSVSRVFGILRTRNESRTVSSVVTCDGGPGERYLQDIAEVILRGGERKLDCVSQQANCVLNRAMSCSPGARFGSCSEFVRALGDAEHLNGTHEKTVALIAPAESNVLSSEKGSSDLEHVPPESESQKRPDISRDSQDNPDIPYSKWAVVVKWIVFVAFSSWVCVISTLSASITCFLWLMGLDALTRSKKYKALTKNGRMCMFALYVGLGGLMAVSASALCDQFIASFQDRESPVSDRTPISLYDAAQNDYKEGNYESAMRNVVELRDGKYIVSEELKRKAAHLAVLCHVKLGNDTAVANWRKLCGCSQCLSDLKQRESKQREFDEKEKSAAAENAAHEAERTKEERRRELERRRQSALALYAEGKLEACLEALVDIPCEDAEVLELRKKCKDKLNEQAAQIALMNDIKSAHAAFAKKDFKTGFDIAVKYGLAKISDSYVTYHVGYCYSPTYGTEYPNDKDYAKAYEWFCKTAKLEENVENGDGITECILGDMLMAGQGVERDAPKAVEFYSRSSQRNYARGCYELARCYEKGLVKDGKNVSEMAKKLYEKSLERADSEFPYRKEASNRVEAIKRAMKNFSSAKFIE